MIYKGLVYPVLEFACSFWDPISSTFQDNLEKIQNNTAKFGTLLESSCMKLGMQFYRMTGVLEQLKCESLKQRRNRKVFIFLRFNGQVSTLIDDFAYPDSRNMYPVVFRTIKVKIDIYNIRFLFVCCKRYLIFQGAPFSTFNFLLKMLRIATFDLSLGNLLSRRSW